MKTILVIGALSGIAEQMVRLYAQRKPGEVEHLILCARSLGPLKDLARSLEGGHVNIEVLSLDVTSPADRSNLYQFVSSLDHPIDLVVMAWGQLTLAQGADASGYDQACADFMSTNLVSFQQIAHYFSALMQSRRSGTLVFFGSVAGDRGRASNFFYGSAKAALEVYAEGLEQALFHSSVRVVLVKPGFVDTAMTRKIPKNFLFAKPESVAKSVVHFIDRGGSGVYYVPWFWFWILKIVRLIPSFIFKRLGPKVAR